jgi:hypothetical protein
MTDLIEFLLAQLDEDETTAGEYHHEECGTYSYNVDPCDCAEPDRRLAEVKAKRAIIAGYEASYRESDDYPGWEGAMYAIAQPYAGREGWRDEWSV